VTARPPRAPALPPSRIRENGSGLTLAVPDDVVEAVAERVVDLLGERLPTRPEPWLDVDAAAEYLAAPRARMYDLVAEGRLRCAKDGRRSLFRREWLDDLLEEHAA
jgi:excisionase family DNA binding protein